MEQQDCMLFRWHQIQVLYEGGQRQTKLTNWIRGTKGIKRKHSALGGDETPPRLPLGADGHS